MWLSPLPCASACSGLQVIRVFAPNSITLLHMHRSGTPGPCPTYTIYSLLGLNKHFAMSRGLPPCLLLPPLGFIPDIARKHKRQSDGGGVYQTSPQRSTLRYERRWPFRSEPSATVLGRHTSTIPQTVSLFLPRRPSLWGLAPSSQVQTPNTFFPPPEEYQKNGPVNCYLQTNKTTASVGI